MPPTWIDPYPDQANAAYWSAFKVSRLESEPELPLKQYAYQLQWTDKVGQEQTIVSEWFSLKEQAITGLIKRQGATPEDVRQIKTWGYFIAWNPNRPGKPTGLGFISGQVVSIIEKE